MKLHFTFFYLSMILDNQEACITEFSSLMTMCCITAASGYSLVKDADKCLWKIQRAMEDPYRGHLEWCIWWSWNLPLAYGEPCNSGTCLGIFNLKIYQFCYLSRYLNQYWGLHWNCYVLLQYTVFDQLKQRLLKGKENKTGKGSSPEALSAFTAFVLGAVSKSIATVLTYPAIRCTIALSNSVLFRILTLGINLNIYFLQV